MTIFQDPCRELYSQLEVVSHKEPYSRLEVTQDPSSSLIAVSEEHAKILTVHGRPTESFWRRKRILLVCLAVIVVVAVIGGTVWGILSKRHSEPSGNR